MPLDDRKAWREFVKAQIALPETDQRWKGMCESLQRQSHGFPARFSSAYAHMIATPKSERLDPRDAPPGAFVFVDDVTDSNRFGHIIGKWAMGPGALEDIPVFTNDVNDAHTGYDAGNVTVCKLGWFPRNWGDSIQFATLWFGNDEIPTVEKRTPNERQRIKTAPEIRQAIANAREVIEWMVKARQDNDGKSFPKIEAAITREIKAQKKTIERLQKLLP